jgi:glycosyltransferase involved in cell wall biosynthesis
MHESKVTIVIPTYNRSKLLKASLSSVFAQDYSDFCIVVIDNASSDDTGKVVQSFVDPRITYIRNKTNIGKFRNWNRAIELNSSKYLYILQDDDVILPEFIRESVLLLDEHPQAAFSFTLAEFIDINGFSIEHQDANAVPSSNIIDGLDYLHRIVAGYDWVLHPTTVVMRSEAIDVIGPFDVPHSRDSFDFNLYLRLAARFDIAFVPKHLAQVRLHAGQDTQTIFSPTGGTGPLSTVAERSDAIVYLLQSARSEDPTYRRWLAERLRYLSMSRSDFTSHFIPHLNLSWTERLQIAKQEITALIPVGKSFILVDDNKWGSEVLPGRCALPFLERDGKYWGPPPDDETAIRELERMGRSGACFIIFGWPAFWWLDYYSDFFEYLKLNLRCVLQNSRLVVFGFGS